MCCIIEIYLVIILAVTIFETYYYYKDGNKKGTYLRGRMLKKGIRHELVHARIANRFGFEDWKIIPKIDGLACSIAMNSNSLNWKSLFYFLSMCGFHFVFDGGGCVIYFNVLGICDYIKRFFLDIKRILIKFIKDKKYYEY